MISHALKLKLTYLWLVLLVLCPISAFGESPDTRLKGFDQFVTEQLKEWKVPGLAIAVVKDGKVIHAQGYGFRDVKKGLEVTPNTIFAIGSCSKAITATTMGLLVDEGKLVWDKPVRDYLPTFKMYDDYVTARLTPRDLVTHRSGLPRHDLVWYGSPLSRKELFDRLQYLEPSRGFREVYQYQNLMYMTAGYLVGELAGTSWEAFTQQRILAPLGMKNSNFSVTVSQTTPDFALPYQEQKDEVKEVPFRNIDAVGPAGSINSSVTEMANWVLLNLNKGKFNGKQIIAEATLQQIHTPQIASGGSLKYDESFYSSYGMGWAITSYRGRPLLAHGGGIDGFTALVAFMPKDNLGLVILSNRGGTPLPSIVAYNVYDRLLGLNEIPWSQRAKEDQAKAKEAAEKAKTNQDPHRKLGTQPSHPLKDYAGKFEHPAYGVLTLEAAGEQLKGNLHGLSLALSHYHYDMFETTADSLPKVKVTFLTNQKGEIDRLSVPLETGVKEIVFTRQSEAKALAKSVLEKLVGEYVLAGVSLKISLRGETLIASVPGQPDYELVLNKGTEFNLKGLTGFSVEFKLDASGTPTEAVVTQPNGVFTAKRK